MMQNWLSIAAAVYLAAMVLAGHHRGFIRMAVSAAALVITLLAVNAAMPQVTSYLKNHTEVYQAVEDTVSQAIGIDEGADQDTPAAQRQRIEALDLPDMFKSELLENNNSEVYALMGVDTFSRYVTGYLVNNIVNMAVYIVLFAVIFGALELAARCLDIVARLPLISGVNKLAGAALGAAEGLIFLWLAFLLAAAFSATGWGMEVNRLIEESSWLSFLYDNNLLAKFAMSLIEGIL